MTVDMLLRWLTMGGVGAILASFVEWLTMAVPVFEMWWKGALTGKMRQGLILGVGTVLSALVYVLLVWRGAIPLPATDMEWLDVLLQIIAGTFGVSQLWFGQFIKKRRA